jgi:hypothetical protein
VVVQSDEGCSFGGGRRRKRGVRRGWQRWSSSWLRPGAPPPRAAWFHDHFQESASFEASVYPDPIESRESVVGPHAPSRAFKDASFRKREDAIESRAMKGDPRGSGLVRRRALGYVIGLVAACGGAVSGVRPDSPMGQTTLDGTCVSQSTTEPQRPDPAVDYPPNRLGDRCRNAPSNACYASMVGLWDCGSVTFTVHNNGYMRISAERLAAGCMDCSGTYATLADDGKTCAPSGTMAVNCQNAAFDWEYCSSGDLERCASAPQGRGHVGCHRVRMPKIP